MRKIKDLIIGIVIILGIFFLVIYLINSRKNDLFDSEKIIKKTEIIESVTSISHKNRGRDLSYEAIDACGKNVYGEKPAVLFYSTFEPYITVTYRDEKVLGFENFVKDKNLQNINKIHEENNNILFTANMCGKSIKATYIYEKGLIASDNEFLKVNIPE